MHRQYIRDQADIPQDQKLYNPDIHYPILLVLTLKVSSSIK